MSWAILLAISILTATASTLLARFIQSHHKLHPAAFTIISNGGSGILLLLLALIHGYDTRWGLIPKFNLAMMAVLWASANVFIMYSLRRVEASLFGVIFTTRVIWTILISVFFLGESLSTEAIIGAFILLFSSGLALWEENLSFKNKSILFCFLASLLFGIAVANDGIIISHGYDVISYFALAFGIPALSLIIFSPAGRTQAIQVLTKPQISLRLAIVAVLNAISAVTIFYAFQRGRQLSILASLNQTQTILMVFGAAIFLKERRYFARRAVAAAISFIGVLLIINAQ